MEEDKKNRAIINGLALMIVHIMCRDSKIINLIIL